MNKKLMIITGICALIIFSFICYDEVIGWPTALIKGALAAALIMFIIWFLIFINKRKKK